MIEIFGGIFIIGGAIYLAIRPYLRPGHKPWMPGPSGRDHNDDKGATNL